MKADYRERILRSFAEATGPAVPDGEALERITSLLRDHAGLPCTASIAGVQVTIDAIDYSHQRLGITATAVRRNRRYRVAILDVEFPSESTVAPLVDAYRSWAEGPTASRPLRPAQTTGPAPRIESGAMVALAILAIGRSQATARELASGEDLSFRTDTWQLYHLVPGEVATVEVRKRWVYGKRTHLSGSVTASRLEIDRLGLVPLALHEAGEWDPQEMLDEWRHDGIADTMESCYVPIIAAGRRPRFEMSQIIPGADPTEMDDDITLAAELDTAGERTEARKLLMALLEQDLRCVDAHAHLGNFALDGDPAIALRHYRVGCAIAELSLPAGFNGLLPWSLIDNRPYLRALHGAGLAEWRLGRFEEAEQTFERILWLNPADDQGVRVLVGMVRARQPWKPE